MNQVSVSRFGKPALASDQKDALTRATSVIPPSWPLDRWIAVNPWWGLRHLPAERASRIPGARAKTSMLMPPAFYRDAWQRGRIREEDLRDAQRESGGHATRDTLLAALKKGDTDSGMAAPSVLDQTFGSSASPAMVAIRQQVARTCGLFFDTRQSRWLVDLVSDGLFASWLEQSQHDPLLDRRTGLAGARSILKDMPAAPTQASNWAIGILNLSAGELEALAHRLLFELVGWSAWCKGIEWQTALDGGEADLCDQLLVILLVWEAIGVHLAAPEQRHQWQAAWNTYLKGATQPHEPTLWLWHRAYERGYQRELIGTLTDARDPESTAPPAGIESEIQAVFCIDVRSEVMRRHLEAACPTVQTLGFAGFFGMPVTHRGLGPEDDMPRLPGLLAPVYRLADSTGDRQADRAQYQAASQREMTRQTVRKAKYSSLSSFTLVETTGLAWGWKLLRDSLYRNRSKSTTSNPAKGGLFQRYGGDPVSDPEKVDLAEQMLRGLSLTTGFAPLLVFVGHGSHTDNNPHQAGLACGACGGQNGGVNAALAARLINDPQVRAGLVARGIRIPDFTLALAAEHCTVTDRVTVLNREQVPDSYLKKLIRLENAFTEAARRSRRERAAALGLAGHDDDRLLQHMTKRTVNWSEVRPEWGLANNAAILFADRSRTRGLNLKGRTFLHDYKPSQDPEGTVLEALMTAPMVVANWINLQYFGSVAAPETFGAGNKLLHSVVGGNVGVIEGNDPDLRIGLALQSVHDGKTWRHEPVRLNVFIDAPRQHIERVLAQQPDVARLVENHWLWLFRFAGDGVEQYRNGDWQAC